MKIRRNLLIIDEFGDVEPDAWARLTIASNPLSDEPRERAAKYINILDNQRRGLRVRNWITIKDRLWRVF